MGEMGGQARSNSLFSPLSSSLRCAKMDTERPRSRQEAGEEKAERPAPPTGIVPSVVGGNDWRVSHVCRDLPAYARLAWKCKSTGSMGAGFSSKCNTPPKKHVPEWGTEEKEWMGRAVGHASLARPHAHTRRAFIPWRGVYRRGTSWRRVGGAWLVHIARR
ncbi:hypothetical protein LX32DRAFT_431661 [Colletotrichum zoysiae]|uniref:Uncharacterized protein n=1 Tax=Colletotrichum zoysiae TaxID=1216348 RepID=A0AAD9M095_9PEZI|nr:hypothetical protein LX32DRAFT_431661 [Colletotrichum zoysiae]